MPVIAVAASRPWGQVRQHHEQDQVAFPVPGDGAVGGLGESSLMSTKSLIPSAAPALDVKRLVDRFV